jgi:cobalt-precorrin 5A hydrolase
MAGKKIMSPRFAIGVGARRGVDAAELADFVREVAAGAASAVDAGCCPSLILNASEDLSLVTIDTKQDEPGFREAANLLGFKLMFLPLSTLLARKGEVLTKSPRVEAMTGVGSVAEAAALAGAGPGSVLVVPRVATGKYTCAIARRAQEGASS